MPLKRCKRGEERMCVIRNVFLALMLLILASCDHLDDQPQNIGQKIDIGMSEAQVVASIGFRPSAVDMRICTIIGLYPPTTQCKQYCYTEVTGKNVFGGAVFGRSHKIDFVRDSRGVWRVANWKSSRSGYIQYNAC
jgi:hypothetical protein